MTFHDTREIGSNIYLGLQIFNQYLPSLYVLKWVPTKNWGNIFNEAYSPFE